MTDERLTRKHEECVECAEREAGATLAQRVGAPFSGGMEMNKYELRYVCPISKCFHWDCIHMRPHKLMDDCNNYCRHAGKRPRCRQLYGEELEYVLEEERQRGMRLASKHFRERWEEMFGNGTK